MKHSILRTNSIQFNSIQFSVQIMHKIRVRPNSTQQEFRLANISGWERSVYYDIKEQ